MFLAILFFVLLIIWAALGGYTGYKGPGWWGSGAALLLFILLLILGWAQFGKWAHG